MRRLPFPGGSTSDSNVGNFRVPIQVGRRGVARFTRLDALVDTGSTYTWISRDVLAELGINPEREWLFELADGRQVRYRGVSTRRGPGERAIDLRAGACQTGVVARLALG